MRRGGYDHLTAALKCGDGKRQAQCRGSKRVVAVAQAWKNPTACGPHARYVIPRRHAMPHEAASSLNLRIYWPAVGRAPPRFPLSSLMPSSSSSASATVAGSTAGVLHARRALLFPSPGHVHHLLPATARRRPSATCLAIAAEGPSCLYVGPLETASKEMLEALYQQARDSYYNGKPLIKDYMFDKVELKLRLYGSKSVLKYPRCSLSRLSTYADAQEDPSQVFALASVWMLLLTFGASSIVLPTLYSMSLAFQHVNPRYLLYGGILPYEFLTTANGMLFMGLGYLIGFPVACAAGQALQGLLKKDLVALKGSCPNCGEEVFAFVKTENSRTHRHRADCHVCDCTLEFRTKVEQSFSSPNRRWVYGRVYLVQQT